MDRFTDSLAFVNYLDEQLRTGKNRIERSETRKSGKQMYRRNLERAYIGCEDFYVLEKAHQRGLCNGGSQ